MRQRPSSSTHPPTGADRPNRFEFRMSDPRYGRGFVAGFLTFFAAFVAACIAVVRSTSAVGRTRSLAALGAAFGGMFLFGFIYEFVRGLGIGVSASLGRWHRSSVLDRSPHPVAYWAAMLVWFIVTSAILGFAAWMWLNADAVATWMARHEPK